MFCSRCGASVVPGQRYCSCGEFLPAGAQAQPPNPPPANLDMPQEFYNRLETRVTQTGKDNFRKGLTIGLGFLLAFLVLETSMDTLVISRVLIIGIALLVLAVLLVVNLLFLYKRWFS